MPTEIEFFDSAVSVTPPQGHFEPQPLTLGASWQPNDVRIFAVSGSGQSTDSGATTLPMPMSPDPPTTPNFTAAYALDVGNETKGVYYRYLQAADDDTAVAWPKPPNWRHYMFATVTARGVDPTNPPVAGLLQVSYTVGAANATVSSVTVPAAGTMVLCLTTFNDPDGGWPSWASSMGVPTGWTHVVATDKSGINYYPYDPNPNAILVGKSFTTSGTTGPISVPIGSGSPAFAGVYFFVRPAADISVTVGGA